MIDVFHVSCHMYHVVCPSSVKEITPDVKNAISLWFSMDDINAQVPYIAHWMWLSMGTLVGRSITSS